MKPHPCEMKGAKRHAVVLIHGMGEQRPMQSVRRFVEAVWDGKRVHDNSRPLVWSKPDLASGSFELRRLTTDYDKRCVRTDFFEFYWAHLMEGTGFSHVLSWARRLLGRWPTQVPGPLKSTYYVLWGIIILVMFVFVAAWFKKELGIEFLATVVPPAMVAVATAVFVWLRKQIIIPVIGDAARYLSPNPNNVKVRHEIRTAAMNLLEQLHDRERPGGGYKYDKIIIVGHSLGSVIGYDVLTHLWPRFNRRFDPQSRPDNAVFKELENQAMQIAAGSGPGLEALGQGRPEWPPIPTGIKSMAETYRANQRKYFTALRHAGNPWRVTDFVTIGCPLTHADVVLSDDPKGLAQSQKLRELPTCPPTLEEPTGEPGAQRFSYVPPEHPDGDQYATDRRVPNHAAVFAPVVWTNLYFQPRAVLWGDVISGPLGKAFGYGIDDVKLEAEGHLRLLSHTKYWQWPKHNGTEVPMHLRALRKALDLQG